MYVVHRSFWTYVDFEVWVSGAARCQALKKFSKINSIVILVYYITMELFFENLGVAKFAVTTRAAGDEQKFQKVRSIVSR